MIILFIFLTAALFVLFIRILAILFVPLKFLWDILADLAGYALGFLLRIVLIPFYPLIRKFKYIMFGFQGPKAILGAPRRLWETYADETAKMWESMHNYLEEEGKNYRTIFMLVCVVAYATCFALYC